MKIGQFKVEGDLLHYTVGGETCTWNKKVPCNTTDNLPSAAHKGFWVTAAGKPHKYKNHSVEQLRADKKLRSAVTSLNDYLKTSHDKARWRSYKQAQNASSKTTTTPPTEATAAEVIGGALLDRITASEARAANRDEELLGRIRTNTQDIGVLKDDVADIKENVAGIESEQTKSAVKAKKERKRLSAGLRTLKILARDTGHEDVAEGISIGGSNSSTSGSFSSSVRSFFSSRSRPSGSADKVEVQAVSSTAEMNYRRNLLVSFYEKANPDMVENINVILDTYDTEEKFITLVRKLAGKYPKCKHLLTPGTTANQEGVPPTIPEDGVTTAPESLVIQIPNQTTGGDSNADKTSPVSEASGVTSNSSPKVSPPKDKEKKTPRGWSIGRFFSKDT